MRSTNEKNSRLTFPMAYIKYILYVLLNIKYRVNIYIYFDIVFWTEDTVTGTFNNIIFSNHTNGHYFCLKNVYFFHKLTIFDWTTKNDFKSKNNLSVKTLLYILSRYIFIFLNHCLWLILVLITIIPDEKFVLRSILVENLIFFQYTYNF